MKRLNSLLRVWNGELTADLVQQPGRFGLGQIPTRLNPDQTTNLVCGFCSTGCELTAHLREGEAINLSASRDYPVNRGQACPKGWEALTPLKAPDRATTPYRRNAQGKLEAVDWETAIQTFCDRFKGIQSKYGRDAVAWIGTGQMCTEELAFLGALGKFGMGLRHGDGNTRQCMATSVVAYKQSFGFDAPPYTYQDFEESDVVVLIGSNLCIAHPILWQRVLNNPHQPEIIVVDPRKTETAMAATQHYALNPKSDLILLYGLAHLLIENGWIDRDYLERHTSGFEAFAKFVMGAEGGTSAGFAPEFVSQATGLSVAQLHRFAATIHQGKRVSFWWTMGVNQGHEATRTAQAIINLALMTGNLGRPGTGANSITGQCNAMGSRLFSNTTNLLGGHDFLNPQHREKVAGILGIPCPRIPDQNSWAYDQIIQGIAAGKIKGLWVIATNPAHSWIDQNAFQRIAEKLEFLVVQDMYHTTETAQLADLILPAAGWGEKAGTFINSERRIGVIRKVAKAPGQALSDFNIFKLIAHYWGCANLFDKWSSPEAVFQLLKELSRGQPCDLTGIRDFEMLAECGGIQWPFATEQNWRAALRPGESRDLPGTGPDGPPKPSQQRRLFEDGRFYHADGKARFIFEAPREMPELPDETYPFILLTGRGSSAQWHTQTRTGKSAVLRQLAPNEIYVEINPADAGRLEISPNSRVVVQSRRGHITVRALVTPTVPSGQLFIPMHHATTNRLTCAVFDPHSRQPSYKACAVRVQQQKPRR